MDHIIAYVIAIWMFVTSLASILFWTTDYREFEKITKACQTTGYIQDTKVRIICAPEKPIDRN